MFQFLANFGYFQFVFRIYLCRGETNSWVSGTTTEKKISKICKFCLHSHFKVKIIFVFFKITILIHYLKNIIPFLHLFILVSVACLSIKFSHDGDDDVIQFHSQKKVVSSSSSLLTFMIISYLSLVIYLYLFKMNIKSLGPEILKFKFVSFKKKY